MIEDHMLVALKEAEKALDANEVPVGAVVLNEKDQIVGKGFNQVEMLKDATAHAEIIAITAAMATIGKKFLQDHTLVVTLEPCPMCVGAIGLGKLSRVIFGAYDAKIGACGSRYNLTSSKELCGSIDVLGGIKENESVSMLRSFFSKLRLN